MTSTGPGRTPGLPDHVRALIVAVVVAVLIPVGVLIVSALTGGIGTTANNVVYVAGVLVVGLLLVRAFLVYRTR
jgi:hypothetical protein